MTVLISQERRTPMIIILLLVLALVLAFAALRWGANSTDNLNSQEWQRRETRGSIL